MCTLSNLSMKISDVSRRVRPAMIGPGVDSPLPFFPITATAHLGVGNADVSIRVRLNP
jgi:hypothetical protein